MSCAFIALLRILLLPGLCAPVSQRTVVHATEHYGNGRRNATLFCMQCTTMHLRSCVGDVLLSSSTHRALAKPMPVMGPPEGARSRSGAAAMLCMRSSAAPASGGRAPAAALCAALWDMAPTLRVSLGLRLKRAAYVSSYS